ncbi:MAG: hypothetical protein GY834_06440 [Bacteroidetes bacterium]|nr:hypothetical protein [Bacteroidota bacterium]
MKFEVVSGKYEGVNFWGNFVVDGSDAAKNISFSTFKSMIRAVRKLEKDDQRPNVFAINDWDELDHLTFPAKLKIKKPRSGDKFVNNELGLVIAPGHKSWDAVKDGGEIITDNEIPSLDSDIAQNQVQSQAGSNPAPNWTGDTPIVEDEIPF